MILVDNYFWQSSAVSFAVPVGALGQIHRRWSPPSNGALNCLLGFDRRSVPYSFIGGGDFRKYGK